MKYYWCRDIYLFENYTEYPIFLVDYNTFKFALQFIYGRKIIKKTFFYNWSIGVGGVFVQEEIWLKSDEIIDKSDYEYFAPSIEFSINIGLNFNNKK